MELVTREVAEEMVRYGATEMHNISAVIGGQAAQETIKLVTQQYYPLNNTYVFNGIVAVGKFFQL
jgi:amyloid beta precursor protein binding protein 1